MERVNLFIRFGCTQQSVYTSLHCPYRKHSKQNKKKMSNQMKNKFGITRGKEEEEEEYVDNDDGWRDVCTVKYAPQIFRCGVCVCLSVCCVGKTNMTRHAKQN